MQRKNGLEVRVSAWNLKAAERNESAREENPAAKQPNVVLIVVDTLRLDRAAPLARTLEGFIDYGYAVSPAPWTLPAHVSMLTGLYPSIHESHEWADMKTMADFARIHNDNSTLMTRLKKMVSWKIRL